MLDYLLSYSRTCDGEIRWARTNFSPSCTLVAGALGGGTEVKDGGRAWTVLRQGKRVPGKFREGDFFSLPSFPCTEEAAKDEGCLMAMEKRRWKANVESQSTIICLCCWASTSPHKYVSSWIMSHFLRVYTAREWNMCTLLYHVLCIRVSTFFKNYSRRVFPPALLLNMTSKFP